MNHEQIVRLATQAAIAAIGQMGAQSAPPDSGATKPPAKGWIDLDPSKRGAVWARLVGAEPPTTEGLDDEQKRAFLLAYPPIEGVKFGISSESKILRIIIPGGSSRGVFLYPPEAGMITRPEFGERLREFIMENSVELRLRFK